MDKRGSQPILLSQLSLVLLLAINLVVIAALVIPNLAIRKNGSPSTPVPTITQSPPERTDPVQSSSTATGNPSQTPDVNPQRITNGSSIIEDPLNQGVFLLSLSENGYTHLFAYQPLSQPFVHLTSAAWEDRDPALSPSGQQIAYASRQNGYWDLFTFDMQSGRSARLTDTGSYDGSPTWSPDGKRLAFETYQGDRFQISLLALDQPGTPPSSIGDATTSNHSPAWSPDGQHIVFISSVDGIDRLVMVGIDQPTSQQIITSTAEDARLQHPAWSPDGRSLAWSERSQGQQSIWILNAVDIGAKPRFLGNGSWPAWSPDGSLVASSLSGPNQDSLIIYQASTGLLVLSPQPLPGRLTGLDWKDLALPKSILQTAQQTPPPLWPGQFDKPIPNSQNRYGLVNLEDLSAPFPSFSDAADDAFQALRSRVAAEAGWDYLASLENAFIPITSPLPPGFENDWLFTGRAFVGDPLPIDAGWIVALQEDYNDQVFWRIFLKTRYQDGSQGQPIRSYAWDLNARHSGDPQVYDAGGRRLSTAPSGYWVDFTSLAIDYGWERLQAKHNWRSYLPAARMLEFVYRQGEDIKSAMLELYPAEVLTTATPQSYPMVTPTPVPTWYRTPTATHTPQPSPTPTRRPTWTPQPTKVESAGNLLPVQNTSETLKPLTNSPSLTPPNTASQEPSLRFVFPTAQLEPVSAWRPPLYVNPWAPGPFDHFYFSRPIAANEVNWPLADYRYGGITPGTDVIHTGIDIDAPEGTPVLATADGEVVWTGFGLFSGAHDTQDPYGLAIAIRHDFGYQGKHLFTIYAHLQASRVILGQRITAGEAIGQVGITGNTTGPHLHFEVRVGENYFFNTRNPELWLVPPQGWGILTGRITNADGTMLFSREILVRSRETGQSWVARTYGPQVPNSDPYYHENLVLSDLPAGNYIISVVYFGVRRDFDLRILPGQVTYIRFQGNKGFSTQLPGCEDCARNYPLDE